MIIRQPVGTVTLWKATKYEHTSSVDECAYVKILEQDTKSDDPLCVGLVIVQKKKLFSVLSNHADVVSRLYSVAVLQAYNSMVNCDEEDGVFTSKRQKTKVKRQRRRRK